MGDAIYALPIAVASDVSLGLWVWERRLKPVLPPIPTAGLGPDDVTALTESTHDQMLATLKEISHPHPSERQPQTPPRLAGPSAESSAESEMDAGKPGSERRQSESGSGEEDSSDGHGTKDSGDGTEDEMDEDAVLLKRPAARSTDERP